MNKFLATTALGMLLATGAYAQATTDPAPDPAMDPVMENEAPATTPLAPADETAQDPAAEPVVPETMAEESGWDLMEGQERVDVSTVSGEALIGARIETITGEKVADVEDVILNENGQVENIAAEFGGFLGFGSDTVLLALEDLDFVKDQNDTLIVRTNLTPEAIEGRPVYQGI